MKTFSSDEISNVGFYDEPVSEFRIDLANKSLSFVADGFVGKNPTGTWYEDCLVLIDGFNDFSVIVDSKKVDQESITNLVLPEICEFLVNDKCVRLTGYSKPFDQWTEIIIKGGHISVTCPHDEDQTNQDSSAEKPTI